MRDIYDAKFILDQPEFVKVFAEGIEDPTYDHLEERAKLYQSMDNIQVFACSVDGDVAGVLIVSVGAGTTEIKELTVKKEYQRRGIATELLDFIRQIFGETHIVAVADENSVGFFKKYGFTTSLSSDYKNRCIF